MNAKHLLIAGLVWAMPLMTLAQPAVSTTTLPIQHGSVSPSAPVNLTYQIENSAAGQPQLIAMMIGTRLRNGNLLVEVVKQEGAEVIGETTQHIDLAMATRPMVLRIQALQVGAGEHFIVVLLTIDTEMGPMSRSFRIDLTANASADPQ